MRMNVCGYNSNYVAVQQKSMKERKYYSVEELCFCIKSCIAYKEARKTKYWIRILNDSNYLNEIESSSLLKDIEEILKIIGGIQRTFKNN